MDCQLYDALKAYLNSSNTNTTNSGLGGYVDRAKQQLQYRNNRLVNLLEQRKLPEYGWSELDIEWALNEFASMDSNNYHDLVGFGEREAKIISPLVRRRHYGFGHGIGKSGNLFQVQPKAVGSSIIQKLSHGFVQHVLRIAGASNDISKYCLIVPMCTGMTLSIGIRVLASNRKQAKWVIWCRIDQKSGFKAILYAGFEPLILEPIQTPDKLPTTNLEGLREILKSIPLEQIVCVLTTTSCFAPRSPDKLVQVARICAEFNVPHLVNNAYGLSSTVCMGLLTEAHRQGRLDLFVQSTDKNLLVPVGGAIIAGPDQNLMKKVELTYPGRASMTPILDVFITMLGLGENGYRALLEKRKKVFDYMKEQVIILGKKYEGNVEVLETPKNDISLALSFQPAINKDATFLGSMLFSRQVSGIRVVTGKDKVNIEGYEFKSWGAHINRDENIQPYLTMAAALGVEFEHVDTFCKKLMQVLNKYYQHSA